MPNKEDTKYQKNQQDGNECQTKKPLNTRKNQYDGNECQTKKTLNTTKLVGWQ